MTDSPYRDPDFVAWAAQQRQHVLPKIEGSAMSLALYSRRDDGDFDIQQALEVGATLLMGKPLILIVTPDTQVPEGLRRAADSIVEGEIGDPAFARSIAATLAQYTSEGDPS